MENPVVVGCGSAAAAPAVLSRARQLTTNVVIVAPRALSDHDYGAGFAEAVVERSSRVDLDALLSAARAFGADHIVLDEAIASPAKLMRHGLVAAAKYLRDSHAASLSLQVVRSRIELADRPYRRILVAADGAVGSGFAALAAARMSAATGAALQVAMLERRHDLLRRDAVDAAVAADPTFDLEEVRRGSALSNRRLEQARDLIEDAGIEARFGWLHDDPASALSIATTHGGYGLVVSGLMGMSAHGRDRSRTAVTRELLEATVVDHLLVLDSISLGVSSARKAAVLVSASAALLLGAATAQPAAASAAGAAASPQSATAISAAHDNSVAAGATLSVASGTTSSGRPLGISIDSPAQGQAITVPAGSHGTTADFVGTVSSGPHHARRNVVFVAVGDIAAEDVAAARSTLRLAIHPDADLRTGGFEDGAAPPEGSTLQDSVIWLKHKLVNATDDATTTVFLVADEANAAAPVNPRVLQWAVHNNVVVHTYVLSRSVSSTAPASGLESLSAASGGTFHRSDTTGFLEDLATTRPAEVAAASVTVNGGLPVDVTNAIDPTGRWVLPRVELPTGLDTIVAKVHSGDGTTLAAYVDVTVTAEAAPSPSPGTQRQPRGPRTTRDTVVPAAVLAVEPATVTQPQPEVATVAESDGAWATSESEVSATATPATADTTAVDTDVALPVTGSDTVPVVVGGILTILAGFGLLGAAGTRRD